MLMEFYIQGLCPDTKPLFLEQSFLYDKRYQLKPCPGLPGCREHSWRGHQGEGGPEEGVGAPTLPLAAGAGLAR